MNNLGNKYYKKITPYFSPYFIKTFDKQKQNVDDQACLDFSRLDFSNLIQNAGKT